MKRRMIKWLTGAAGLLLGMNVLAAPVLAAEALGEPQGMLIATRSEATPIANATEFLKIAEDPCGAYVLTADVQMEGVKWEPFAFHGTLDGAGFSVLNLSIKETGTAVRETFDGNMKVYDTYFAGLFDELSDGCIKNLNLVNLRIDAETDLPCFIGAFAGYMENAAIENCSVQGMLQLRAHDRMFGVGGLIGYGCGSVESCTADVTLTCIDTDASTKDEQFMGGVCAAGYPDVHGCSITIRGFDSDHGYVHDGGLIGMYMFYPKGNKYRGSITDNYVSGKITFYEDNKNRRAYCNGFIGEIMNWDFENGRNKNDFVRDEVFTYNVDLVPHSCDAPVMAEEVIVPGCEFGYVRLVCEQCGYEEKDHYTLREHDYEWTVIKEPTVEEEGIKNGTCKNCGAEKQEMIPKLIPEPSEESVTEESSEEPFKEVVLVEELGESAGEKEEDAGKSFPWGGLLAGGGCIAVIFIAGIAFWKKGKRRNKK